MSQGQQSFKSAVQEYLLCICIMYILCICLLCICYSLSEVKGLVAQLWPFVTPWTVARQSPLSTEFAKARILEWVAIPFSRGSSPPRDKTHVSCNAGRFFTIWATKEKLQHRTNGSLISLLKHIYLEKEMATRSSILAWTIPWTEEPGGLQSMGSQESDTTWQLNHHHHHLF